MKQLALAMHNYHDTHGKLPPAVVYGKDGEPLYSWRVLLLPYIEQHALYKEFHLDEPWDSPHNVTLLPRMPRTYAPPPGKASKVAPHHTVCQVFVGPGTPFEGTEGVPLNQEGFPDGTSNTFLIVEAGEPVPWTKPAELPYAPDQPLPDLRGLFRERFRAGLADGSMRWVRKETSEATIRAAITRNGGERLGPDW
jgi:hypothetical protein